MLTNTASDEGEHERRISGDLRRYLELLKIWLAHSSLKSPRTRPTKKAIGKTEQNDIDCDDDALDCNVRPELTNTSENLADNPDQHQVRGSSKQTVPSRLRWPD